MRVISGEYGGRPLKSLPSNQTRPTSDKVKEAIFHMLGPYFDGGLCLDLYAGSGALAIEAVSRGIDQAYLVEKNPKAIKVIQENLKMTKDEEKFQVIKGSVQQVLATLNLGGKKFRLVFLDPPYDLSAVEADVLTLIDQDLVDEHTSIYCEVSKETALPEQLGPFSLNKTKDFGQTKINIYEFSEDFK